MKQLFLFLTISFFSWSTLDAQSYDLTAGMRMGTDWGLTGQFRVAKKVTIEGILQSSLQREEVLFTALVEQHNPLISRRLNVYYGVGLHKGWINNDPELLLKDPAGVTMVAGLEFTIAKINLSYDIKPAINITGGEHRFYTQSGISMRYVIAKKNSLFPVDKKKQRERKRKKRQKARAKKKK